MRIIVNVRSFLLACLIAFSLDSNGFELQMKGPKALALGGIAMHERCHWASFENPAGLALQTTTKLGVALHQRFMMSALNTGILAFGSRLSNGGYGIGLHHYGFEKYRETRIAFGYGIQITENVAFGVQLNAFDARFGDNYERHFSLIPAMGLIFSPSHDWEVACRFFNPLRIKRSRGLEEQVSGTLGISAKKTYSEQLSITAAVEKSMNYPLGIATGLSYYPFNNVEFLLGFRSENRSLSWGFSYQRMGLEVVFANAWSQYLGISTNAGISFQIKSKS